MTVVLPAPVPLDPPTGDPAAVADAFRSAAAAACWLAPLGDDVAAAQGSVPHWHGMDAAAASTAISGVAAFARITAPAVLRAAAELSSHARLLEEARQQVGRLVAEQNEDFRSAWRHLAHVDSVGLSAAPSPAAQAIVEELTSSEHARRSRHATLLDEVRADAVATARVLAECSAAVGGAGRRNDEGRVVAHLAAALPDWGRQELAALGRLLADSFLGPITPRELESRAGEAAVYAGTEAFADSFLAAAGQDGVRGLLNMLGDDVLGPASA